jgi:methylmalonyl-CoA/ethylmalonyl-CoA epimerase
MTESLANMLNLAPLNQVGFVYEDLNAAIALYEPLFGPFEIQNYGEMEWIYRGKPETSELYIAFGKSGDVEIELIQWVSGATPHKEFIDAGHEGMQHLRFPVDCMADTLREAEKFGYKAIWQKEFAKGLEAAYLEREGDPLLVELFENKFT